MADRPRVVVTEREDVLTYTCVLPREKESAPLARKLVMTLLSQWELPGLVDDAALVLDELVANSADHARGASIQVTITRKGHAQVRLAVVDMERKHPRLVVADTEDEGGRGLRLVAGISQRWGVDTLRSGKRVWADVAATS
jgi:anti-sigma regulatory factor (Ser/Thr protein kinase)